MDGWMDGRMEGWKDGRVGGKAGLRIAYSNQKMFGNHWSIVINGIAYFIFNGTLNIQVRDILAAMIKISDIDSDIDKNLRVICLKVIRKVVEQENKGKTTPAS